MKLSRHAILVAAAAIAAGCDVNAGGTPTVNPPAAYVRYVNAVNDLAFPHFLPFFLEYLYNSSSFFPGLCRNGMPEGENTMAIFIWLDCQVSS